LGRAHGIHEFTPNPLNLPATILLESKDLSHWSFIRCVWADASLINLRLRFRKKKWYQRSSKSFEFLARDWFIEIVLGFPSYIFGTSASKPDMKKRRNTYQGQGEI
jgi:hypothetical protein